MTILYSDVEPLSKYSPVTLHLSPATRILNENPGKWINNTIKSNSVRYHMHHRKNLSFLSSFGLRAVFDKGSKIAVFLSIVRARARCTSTVTPTFYYFFYHYLDLLHQRTKFHLQSMLGSFTKESP